ncbi:MAG: hypothetical protein ACRC8Y_10165 [Chroococcales cyanobacterium]
MGLHGRSPPARANTVLLGAIGSNLDDLFVGIPLVRSNDFSRYPLKVCSNDFSRYPLKVRSNDFSRSLLPRSFGKS